MTDTKTTHTPALPPGYRLDFTESGIGLGGMFTAYGPKDHNLGGCGGGSGRNADKANARRAAELCWADFGRKCPDLLAASERADAYLRHDTSERFGERAAVMKGLRAAIARARGEA